MAKPRKVTVSGIAEWAKVFPQNRDLEGWKGKYQQWNGCCTIDLILDDENIDRLISAGCSKKPKPDLEGRGQRVKFERRYESGFDWSSGPPVVTKLDGTPWSLEDDGLIGNGSLVEVDVTIYDTQHGISGQRLDRVMVTDLVSYNITPQATQKPDLKAVPTNEEAILF